MPKIEIKTYLKKKKIKQTIAIKQNVNDEVKYKITNNFH